MPFVSKRPKINLTVSETETLTTISKSRNEPRAKVERAKMILLYSEDKTISSIARELHTNRPRVERCIDKALEYGIFTALKDLPRKGKPPVIDRAARAWLISIACMKPKELGLASEFWTLSALAEYIRTNCIQAGYSCLKKIQKGTLSKIFNKSDLKPHKISYYLERKDPEFERKMAQVLHLYKEVDLYRSNDEKPEMLAVLSYDEKPGIQAIENIAPDLRPLLEKHAHWKRDHQYRRHGTVSLLASTDLITGKVYAQVTERHRSREFIDYLKYLNDEFPNDMRIKIILDNHSSHISKETKAYLKTVPGRFEFIFTPTHASWLNLIEVFFSKMTRSFLRGIRVKSKEELKNRILNYINEINQMPTIFRWKWKMDEICVV